MLTQACAAASSADHAASPSLTSLVGSYSPQQRANKPAYQEPGSASFCATARSFSASGASSSSDTGLPGPGQHGVPAVACTGADLKWASQHKPGAAAAFKAPSHSTISATQLREQLQQQKYRDRTSIPWLLAPPSHTGGRPLPGPTRSRTVQSARAAGASSSTTARALQDEPRRAAARSALGAFGASGLGAQPLVASCRNTKAQCVGRATWQVQDAGQPGPGSYNLLQYTALQDRPLKSAFMQPFVQDRFGASMLRREQHQQQQQPQKDTGRQHASQQHLQQELQGQRHASATFRRGRSCNLPQSRQPGVSAGFKDRSPGHAEAMMAAADAGLVGAPGPSYYSPQRAPHKVSYRQARSARSFVAVV